MTSSPFSNIINTSLVDALRNYWENLSSYLNDLVILLNDKQSKTLTFALENLPYSVHFSNFQWKLLKGFSLILLINLLLICVAWKIFGKNICDRFMKPGLLTPLKNIFA